MNAMEMASQYKQQQIMTASPEELTLMLYNGAIRFVTESIQAIEKKNIEKANEGNIRAQDIIRELMNTLDMKYEMAKDFYQLYEYVQYRLIQANIQKDTVQLQEVKEILQEIRDAWSQAMKEMRGQRAVAR